MLIRVLILLMLGLSYSSVYAESRPFTILSTSSPPFKYLDEKNQPAGVHIEIWKLIFAELGIKYRFEFYNSSSERVKIQIEQGLADMHFSLSKKPERMKVYIYPEESYLSHTYSFFIRAEDKNKIIYNRLEDLRGLRVGATQSYSYSKDFWQAGLDLDIVVNDRFHIPKLLAKRIDIVPLKKLNYLYNLKQHGSLYKINVLPKPLTSRQYYNAFSKVSVQADKQYVIDNYDRIVRRMKRDGTIAR